MKDSIVTLALLLCVVLILGFAEPSHANDVPKEKLTKPRTVVSGMLRQFMAQRKRSGRVAEDSANGTNSSPFIMSKDKILVDVYTISADGAPSTEEELQKLGMRVTGRYSNIISGYLPCSAVDSMDSVKGVASCQASLAFTRKGSKNTHGEAAMRLPLKINDNTLNGTGITVGVLSDSFNRLGGAAADISTGDLPNDIVVYAEGTGGADEGRAMLQIVHDLAPAARLMFATAFSGVAGFAANVLAMAGCPLGSDPSCQPAPYKAKVIVDDVGYFLEPVFSDGIVAQAATLAYNSGVTFVSAFGNAGAEAWQASFYPGSEALAKDYFYGHDIGDSDTLFFGGTPMNVRHGSFTTGEEEYYFIPFDLADGESTVMTLHWQQPSRSAMGGLGGCQNDLDIYALQDFDGDGQPETVIAQGTNANIDNGEPVEVMQVRPLITGRVYILVVLFEGEATGQLLRVSSQTGGTFPPSLGSQAPTGFGHPNAMGAIGVGASFARETPAFCFLVPLLESYSSLGGTPILFNALGQPQYELRERPDITAPDGALTTFFGQEAREGFLFFGTSASAPHVAGLAALMYQARPSLTPAQVRTAMRTGCDDMDDPYQEGFQSGYDFASGAGLVNAYNAITAAQNLFPTGPLPSSPPNIPGCVEPPPRF